MSDQSWNTPGPPPPQDPNTGQGWGTPPQPPGSPQDGQWGGPPPPGPPSPQQTGQWGGQQPGQIGGPQPGQWGGQPQNTSGGLDPKLAGVLAYVPFGWLGGLVVYLVNKDQQSRFHGAQSVMLNIASAAVFIALSILGFILGAIADFLGLIIVLAYGALALGLFALVVYLAIQAYQGKKTALPVIGPMAEEWSRK